MKRSDTETALVAAAATVRPVNREDVTAMIAAAKVKKSIKWADVAKVTKADTRPSSAIDFSALKE